MSNEIPTRILLNIDAWDRRYRYSDRDGYAYNFTTSNDGEVIVEDDIILYQGVITNSGSIKETFNVKSGKSSISNVSVTVYNKDRLDLGNERIAIESADATIYVVEGDMYDQVVGKLVGKIDNISFDEVYLKFSIRTEEIIIFKNVPEKIFNEETFQTRLILHDANVKASSGIVMRFGDGGISGYDPSERIVARYVKEIDHHALGGKGENYWRGSRIDTVDATGSLADPEDEDFAIGEFAVITKSDSTNITLPTVLDRYVVYNFIENGLRTSNEETPAIGTLTAVAEASLTDGDYFVLGDGVGGEFNFYFDESGGYSPPAGGIEIDISGAGTDVAVATLIVSAINGSSLDVVSDNESGTIALVTITNNNNGPVCNIPIFENVTTSLTPTGMSGGGPTTSYDMHDIINNTMRNTSKGIAVKLKNGEFEADEYWTKGTGWTITGGKASCDGTQVSDTNLVYIGDINNEIFSTGTSYEVIFYLSALTAGTIRVRLRDTYGPVIDFAASDLTGVYKQIIVCGSGLIDDTFHFEADLNFIGDIEYVKIRPIGAPVFQLTRRPVPENADSVGRPFPIVYGSIEKMWSVWAISAKSTRQNSLSAGDDVYVIAGHKIKDERATDIKVFFGLDENAQGMNYKPGTIDYVPNPLPNSIAEIDHWNESGYSLRDPSDSTKNVTPFHKLIELTTNDGDIVTAVQLRGDEYTGWFLNNSGVDNSDGDLPAVNGQPQFPIRYGLGNSKIYVSFRGHKDTTGTITGIPEGLIEHPIDIIKHFILNYTNVNKDYSKIDDQSFADAKAKLDNWTFAVAITDIVDGKKILDRISQQCKTTWRFVDGAFTVQSTDLENTHPDFFIDQKEHIAGSINWKRPKISEMYNDFIFKYGFNSIKNNYDRVVIRNKTNDQLCRDMYSQYGIVRSLKAVECPDIFDSFTINRLADHYVNLYATQRKEVSTTLRILEDVKNIKVGNVVEFTFYDENDDAYIETYLCISVGIKKNAISISGLQLITT